MSDALQRWASLTAFVNGRPHATPGVRDVEHPCEAFEPGEPARGAECFTDGHYLCDECTRRASCECGCGHRPTQCQCDDCGFANTCPSYYGSVFA